VTVLTPPGSDKSTVELVPPERAELEALIEEARRRARRRRAGYAAVIALVALVAGGLFVAFGGAGGHAASHLGVPPRTFGRHGATRAPETSGADPRNVYETDVLPNAGVQLVSARVGFALSGQPTSGFDGGLASPRGLIIAWPSPSVIATYDGAHHWTRSLAIPGGFWGVDALDPNDVWAVGVKALYRSVDGGKTWQRAGEPPRPLVRVAFNTATDGFGLTATGRLVQTTDAGESWSASRWRGRGVTTCAANGGTILVADQNGAVWRSVDGGSRWVQVAPGLRLVAPPVGWLTQLSCHGSNAVELATAAEEYGAGGDVARVRQTTDDGRTWRTIASQVVGAAPTVSHPTSVPNALAEATAVGTRAACLVGDHQVEHPPGIEIGCTAPGIAGYRGAAVPELPFPGKSDGIVVQGIDFLNAQTAWLMLDSTTGHHVGGPSGDRARTEVLATQNGGLTWRPAYLSPSYRAVTCPHSGPAAPICWRNPLG
jgi:photosystem II stability/assembly factor-like uncharacterized protein